MQISNPSTTMEIIRKYGFTTRKRFGQNFLIDENIIQQIMDATGLTEDDCALEIGPGIGALTQHLARRAGRVVAVEIDRNLIPILQETLAGCDNVTVINQDILKTDLQEVAKTWNHGNRLKVVANLPYYITTPIVMQLLESRAPIASLTLMVQKEVADRMQAGPGTKDYGALSLAVQYYAKVRVVTTVSPGCFIPRPNVDSAVIHLDMVENGTVPVRDPDLLFRLIRASFNQRRKTLANALKNAEGLSFSREQIVEILDEMGLPATVRGEALTPAQFARLSDLLMSRL